MVIPFVKALKQWISIKNGSLDGQIVNGCIQVNNNNNNNNSASKAFLNNSNRPHSSTINHKRHNSTSQQHQCYNNSNYNHNHSLNNQCQYENARGSFSHNNASFTNGYKKLSKSNENLEYLNQSSGSNSKSLSLAKNSSQKSIKFNFKNTNQQQNNPFLKHYTAYNNNLGNNLTTSEPLSPITSSIGNQLQIEQSIKSQSQYYHRIQQNEFADLLNLKEVAKQTKRLQQQSNQTKNISPIRNNNNTTISLNSNSKFKPVNSNNVNNVSVNNSNKKMNNNTNTSNFITSTNSHSVPTALSTNNNITNISHSNKHQQHQSQTQGNLKETIMLKSSTSISYNLNYNNYNYNNNNNSQNNSNCTKKNNANLKKVKKHLEFNGPECWVNFKFDYASISQILPQTLLDL
jgi:hypothetical protein